jgi:glutamine cyclotransferase
MRICIKFILLLSAIILITTNLYSHPGKIVKDIKSPGKFPTGLTFDGQHLWLADYHDDKIYMINPDDGSMIRSIPSPGFWPMGLAWDGKYLWNADAAQKKIFKIDPKDGTILFTIDTPTGNPDGLTWDGTTLWITDFREKKIMQIDLNDGTAVMTYPAPAKSAQGLTFDGKYLWCADRLSNEIYAIDPDNGEVIIILKSPGEYPRGLAWDGKYLWNADYQDDRIYQLVSQDDEKFLLSEKRDAQITFTHEAKVFGPGLLKSLNTYIAIPENLNQQKIHSIKFDPQNYQEKSDRWGQKIAALNFEDKPGESILTAKMIVEADISEIQYFIFPDQCGTLKDIPKDISKKYTTDGSKYKLSDPYIQKLSKEIVNGEENPYWIARKIFDYVRTHLEYKLEGGWNVAPVVLKRGTGSCSEYSISFIALARAAGLPARYVGAIVVRGDDASMDDVFHRWPEVYLPNYGWIPIDPQGGDKELSADRARYIGRLSNRFLITTQGGGDSEYLGWYYNYNQEYETDPQVEVLFETFAEWEPLAK